MADNINFLPPQQQATVQQSQVTQGATTQGAPPTPKLPSGTVLTGFVVNRDASGSPVLRTDTGDVVLPTQTFLKIGSEVTVRIDNQPGGGQAAHVLSINGQPPEIAEAQNTVTDTNDVVSTPGAQQTDAAAAQDPAQIIPSSITARGTLISAPADSLPQGTQLTFKIAAIATPGETAAPATETPQQTTTTNPAQYAAYARASGAPAQAVAPAAATAQVEENEIVVPGSGTTAPVQTVAEQPQTAAPQVTVAVADQVAAQPVIASAQPAEAIVSAATQPATPQPASAQANAVVTAAAAQPATATVTVEAVAPVVQTLSTPPQTAQATPVPATPQVAAPVTETVETAVPITVAAPQAQPATPGLPLVSYVQATPQTTAQTAQAVSPLVQNTPVVQLAAGQTVTAIALGQEPTGEALLQTPSGIVRLQAGISLPQGSLVSLDVVDVTPPQPLETLAALPLPPVSLPELGREWTSLQQIVSLLVSGPLKADSETPATVPPFLAGYSPRAAIEPQQLTSGMIQYVAALSAGNFAAWLGEENVQWLQDNGYDNVVKKAEAEFLSIARQYADVQPQQWQTLFFPVAVDGHVQQVRFFIKRDRKKPGAPKPKNEDTRFVLEVSLSRMGAMQLDGFVRRNDKAINFDLFIRSLSPLPKDVENDIVQLYNSIGELTGYKGNLLFQSVKEFPVNPMEEVLAKANKTVLA